MHKIFIYLFLALFSLVGFSCQKKQPDASHKQTARINIGGEPQTLDPRKARSVNSGEIVRMLFDGLTRENKQGQAELALADRCEVSPDLKTYTFHLKETFWSNADPVTASDFAYAWKKVLSPDFPSDTAFHLYVIKNAKAAKEGKISLEQVGIRTPDEKTLIVELENPIPYFLELLTAPAFLPVNHKVDQENPGWMQSPAHYVSNGPFKLTEWKHNDYLALEKNEKYWDAAQVKLAALKLLMLNEETELKMFEKKELDWAGSPLSVLPLTALKVLKEQGKLRTQPGLGTYFIRTNTLFPPLSQPAIRKAFAIAINRQAIIEHIAQGNQLPATALVPPSFALHKEPCFQDGDQKHARELFQEGLAALHLTKEQLPEISYLYRMTERNHLIAQAIQQQWYEAFGIRVRLEAIEGKVFFDRVSKQDFHFAYADWVADFADPINFLEVFKYKRGGSNNTHWENVQYAQLLDQSAETTDPKQRFELLAKSEQLLMEEMPIIPVLYSNMLYLSQDGLKDVGLTAMGLLDFKWAHVEDRQTR